MKSRKNKRKKSHRERMVSFKVHAMIYLGVGAFFWGIWFLDGAHWHDPFPLFINLAWGLGLFIHFVGGVLGPKWRDQARRLDNAEMGRQTETPYFSSEYSIPEEPNQKRGQEDWDGVDVSVHDVNG